MKKHIVHRIATAATFVIGLGTSAPVLATSTGVQNLGAPATALDVYTFTCPVGTVSARARVHDLTVINNIPASMRLALGFDGAPTVTVSDVNPAATGGEGGNPSAFAVVADGAGPYAMAVGKTAVGADAYMAEAVCVNGVGVFSNPVLTKKIDQ